MIGRRSRGPTALTGTLRVPGDKSLSHRALVFGAMSGGPCTVTAGNTGEDVAATAECLRALGVAVEGSADSLTVTGTGGLLAEPVAPLYCGNSGTTMRLLLGLCATGDHLTVLTGDETLNRRPMLRVVAPLREMGARLDGRNHGDLAPLTVRGGSLAPVDKDLPVASAQVKTALLIAGMAASGTTRVREPGPSRDHSERMLGALGVPVEVDGASVSVTGPATPQPFSFEVPGDISSALFLVGAALVTPGSDLTIEEVSLNPGRTGALEVLAEMGADLTWEVTDQRLGEPVGTITARHSELAATEVGGTDLIPRLIDEIPLLAVVATQASGTTVFRDAAELRVKESDRVSAMVTALEVLGVRAEARDDGLAVTGPVELTGGTVDSLGDHRVAMAMAVAGTISSSKVTVQGWSSVATSFPEFLTLLGEAGSSR